MKPFALDFCVQNISIHMPCTMHLESYILIEKGNHLFPSTLSIWTRWLKDLLRANCILWYETRDIVFLFFLHMDDFVMIRAHGIEWNNKKMCSNWQIWQLILIFFWRLEKRNKCLLLICKFIFWSVVHPTMSYANRRKDDKIFKYPLAVAQWFRFLFQLFSARHLYASNKAIIKLDTTSIERKRRVQSERVSVRECESIFRFNHHLSQFFLLLLLFDSWH